MNFLEELKRRHVYRVAAAYVVVGWLLIQVATQVFPFFRIPDWSVRLLVLLVLAGFPVALVLAWAFDATPHGITRTDADGQPVLRRARHGTLVVAAVGVLIAALIGSGYWWWHRVPVAAPTATTAGKASTGVPAPTSSITVPAKSVAVLPFENLSTDKANAYFADGMQDLILTKLADIGDLKVISRTSTMKYASHPDDLKTIGRQLGVATILEGSVQKAGKQVLINVQLIDAKTDAHLWAQSYQRTLDNIFGVEGEVAGKVADALKAKLSPAESADVANVPTQNPAAFDDYLRGQHYDALVLAGNFEVIPKAVDAYRKATLEDPKFALAWTKLAMAQVLLSYAGIDISAATRQHALNNARRALALAPGLAQAHLALGYVYRVGFHDYDKALAEFRIARQGLPNNADVEQAIAYIEDIKGNVSAANAGLRRAATLSPRDPNLALSVAQTWQELHQYDKAMAAARRALAIAPDDPEGFVAIARTMVLSRGDVNGALTELEKAPPSAQSSPSLVYARINFLLLKRDYHAALREADRLQPGGRFITPQRAQAKKAWVHHLAGDEAGAKALYAHALELARSGLAARPDIVQMYWVVASAEAGLGHPAQARQAIDHALAASKRRGAMAGVWSARYRAAVIDAQSGDAGSAVERLRQCLDKPTGQVVTVPLLKLDPVWDPIRKDPRFQVLLEKYSHVEPAEAASGADHG